MQEALQRTGAAELQSTRSKIKKSGRRILQDLANLRAASASTRQACDHLSAEIMPVIRV
jgi:hypothetical protein